VAKKTINVIYKVDDAQLLKLKKSLVDSEKESKKLSNELDKTGKAAKNAGKEGSDSFFNLSNIVKAISVAAITQQLFNFTKEVIKVRGEFQKFEAVLTNTLGSKSAALIALGRINEFAKSTPYGVSELTNSFIKLANRGVEPTVKEMRAIADLSATLGKDFDQVIEAILDINNPERWKEIGVKAETAGDKVKLSFRDAKIEVDRTVRGVTDAVVALGQLNGVAGSTEAISRTLAGQTSNLSDSWEQLLNTIGKGNEGVLFDAVSLLSNAIDKANELLKNNEQKFEELTSQTLAAEVDSFTNWVNVLGDVEKAEQIFSKKREARLASISKRQRELLDQGDAGEGNIIEREKELAQLRSLYEIYDSELPKAIAETAAALKKKGGGDEETIGLVAALERKINDLTKAIQNTTQTGDLGKDGLLVKQLKETREELDKLLGKDTQDSKAFDEYMKQLEAEMKAEEDLRERTEKSRLDRERDSAKNSADLKTYYYELEKKKLQEIEDEKFKIAEDAAARKADLEEDIRAKSERLAESVFDFILSNRNDDMEHIRGYYDEQIELAGDNEKVQKELRIKRDRDVEAARARQKESEKKEAKQRILISGLVAIAKTFDQWGYPAGIIPAALMAALTAVQVATVDKYKDGGWVKGPGGETEDRVPILASPNEFVVKARSAKQSPRLLELINNRKIDDRILQVASGGGSFSDSRMVSELGAIRKEIQKNRPDDVIERHGKLMRATKRGKDYVMYMKTNVMGDF